MRPTLLSLITVLFGLPLAPYPVTSAAASCAAPSLRVEGHQPGQRRVELVRGQEVTVSGAGFVDGCDDGGQAPSGFGCSGGDGEAVEPLTDVELFVLQGREQTLVGVTDAGTADGNRGWVSWTFTVPQTLELGPAKLRTEGSEPLRARIVAH